MVYNTVDGHPVRLDAIAVVFLLHLGIERILVLPLLTLPIVIPRTVVKQRGLIHVVLSLVIPVHHQVENLKLGFVGGGGREMEEKRKVRN